MIKNIPNKYTISSFLAEINVNFKNTYDIFYLPIDYVNKCNLGFAFINFVEPFHIILFYELYRGKKWKKFNSDKICELLYRRMLANMKAAGAQSIGLTLFPAYPDGFFANPMMGAYQYQNGGDWTWFGARWIEVLVRYGMIREAYDELKPMLQRTVDGGFYEWYHLDGTPVGSGTYRGTAGVLYRAIKVLRRPSYYELKRIG